VERRHLITLVPAREPAGIVPHTVAAPAMIDVIFINVKPPVTGAPFFEDLLDQVNHVAGVVRPVITAIDEEDIELLPIKPEFLFVVNFFKLTFSAGALRAFFRRFLAGVDIPAHAAFPAFIW